MRYRFYSYLVSALFLTQLLSCARYGFKISPCNDIDCSGHGSCIEDEGEVYCQCDEGFKAEGLTCVEINLTVCEDATQCDDQNDCTEDSCNEENYCIHTPTADGTSCEDGSGCSSQDKCLAGKCIKGITDKDNDADGYYDAKCAGGDDCDDNNKEVNPNAVEGPSGGPKCTDQLDNDCDGFVDDVDTGCISCKTDANCDDKNSCTNDSCLPNGNCENLAVANGQSCDDNNACTQSDSCQAGKCVGFDPISCSALDDCHSIGVCDPKTGNCSNPPKSDGTNCDDQNACTQLDSCQAGVCIGSNPITCTALDQCHNVGTCNTSTGICSNPNKTNGTSCNDSNSCTQTDTCQSGICTGSNPVTCTALDNCHNVGTCNTSTGICTNPIKTDGTNCSNGLFCDGAETCQSGVCTDQADPCTASETCNESTDTCASDTTSLTCLGISYSCAMNSSGALRCFGINAYGQIGNNSTSNQLNPVTVSGLTSGVVSCGIRYRHSCAVRSTGQAYCWGWNTYGQLGNNSTSTSYVPVSVSGGHQATQVSVGAYHSCFVREDGTVWCWGYNNGGRLGDNTTTNRSIPTQVHGVGNSGYLTNITHVSAGENHTCAVSAQGYVYCWGYGSFGQLGNGSTAQSYVPVQVSTISGVKSVEAGFYISCAIKTDGTVYCWGENANGKLGIGTTTESHTPVQVRGPLGSGYLTNVTSCASIFKHVCVAKNDGTAWCWGLNDHGQLGNGSTTNSYYPVQVRGSGGSGYLTNVNTVGAGNPHSCAVKNDYTTWCWGYGLEGALGTGDSSSSTYPVQANM